MPGRKNAKAEIDEENPEWTVDDFARARAPREVLPASVLSAFKKTRGPQREPTKVPVSLRLSADVVEYFRATGPGWQRRIDETLKNAMSRKR
jgi:uncharacterized protein (DUF4415 family)